MDGEEIKLECHEVSMGMKALGAKLRHDGVETENVNWFRGKVEKWANRVRTGKLSQDFAWKA